jgi:hypothetical protein
MHNGVYTNLWDVVEHYNFGGGTGSFSGSKEAAISPLLLTDRGLIDGVYTCATPLARPVFHPAPPLEDHDVDELTTTLRRRIVLHLQAPRCAPA